MCVDFECVSFDWWFSTYFLHSWLLFLLSFGWTWDYCFNYFECCGIEWNVQRFLVLEIHCNILGFLLNHLLINLLEMFVKRLFFLLWLWVVRYWKVFLFHCMFLLYLQHFLGICSWLFIGLCLNIIDRNACIFYWLSILNRWAISFEWRILYILFYLKILWPLSNWCLYEDWLVIINVICIFLFVFLVVV